MPNDNDNDRDQDVPIGTYTLHSDDLAQFVFRSINTMAEGQVLVVDSAGNSGVITGIAMPDPPAEAPETPEQALDTAAEEETASEDEEGDRCSNCRGNANSCECFYCSHCENNVYSICSNCDHCERCCECAMCHNTRCGNRVSDVCEECGRCPDCCGCRECMRCDGLFRTLYCGEHCSDCCDCGDEDDDGDGSSCFALMKSRDRFHKGKPGDVGPVRFVSAEIEVANADDDLVSSVVRRWGGGIVEDGSLPSTGCEINTAPAKGSAWRSQIQEIGRALYHSGASVTNSCGLHVHVDARDFNYYDIRRLMKLYYRIEPGIYGLVSNSRRGIDTCRPCGDQFAQCLTSNGKINKKEIFMAVYGQEPGRVVNKRELKYDKYNGARYRALNLHSWLYHGTIECRLHQGSTNAEKIQWWGELWSAIIEFVATHQDKEIDAMWSPDYTFDSSYRLIKDRIKMTDSYRLLRDTVCAGNQQLQSFLDERARHFGYIQMEVL